MMRYLILLLGLTLVINVASAQLVGISVEEYAVHTGDIPSLNGMITYRIYANLTNASDEISAVYGDATSPLTLTSVDGFFQSDFGASTGWNIHPAFIQFAAEAEFDSWITLGVSNEFEVTGQPIAIGMDDAIDVFETGGDFVVNSPNGGSWFTLLGDTQAQAGPDLKVMLAQLTTSGSFTGSFNVQVFLNGEQSASTQYEGIPFSSSAGAIFGCMDPEATNYNPDATEAGETCMFPCDLTLTGSVYPSCNSMGGTAELVLSNYQLGWYIEELSGLELCTEDWCAADFLGENAVTVRGLLFFLKHFGSGNEQCDLNGDGLVATPDLLSFLSVFGNSILDTETNSIVLGNLPVGFYDFNSIDGAGCTTEITLEILQGTPLTATASIVENPSCHGFADGMIEAIEVVGGVPPYSYRLLAEGTEYQFSPFIGNVPAGAHSIEVMDAIGCVGLSQEVVLEDPQEFFLTAATVDEPLCFGTLGQVLINWSGGIGSTTFSIDGANFSFQPLILSAGGYSVTGQDSQGCLSSNSIDFDLIEPSGIDIEVSVLDSVPTGQAEIESFVSGGSPPYSWLWSGPDDFSSLDSGIAELVSGEYFLTVQDVNGCSESAGVLISTFGCTDANACNYDAFSSYDGSVICDFQCYGCTDPEALNYNPEATMDNGECTYYTYTCADAQEAGWDDLVTGVYFEDSAEHVFGIETVFESVLHLQGIYQDDNTGIPFTVNEWTGLEFDGFPFGLTFDEFPASLAGDEEFCLFYSGVPQDTGVFTVTIQGTLEVSLFNSVFEILDYSTTLLITVESNPNPIEGCLDVHAANFLSYGNQPDGSCLYAGCMDPIAANYYPVFSIQDDSCIYCDDSSSSNCVADLNGDDSVNTLDLLIFLSDFGMNCE